MNDSKPRINEGVKRILQKEPAFDGTVKEGSKRKFTVLNEQDVEKYLSPEEKGYLNNALYKAGKKIEEGRELDGKEPFNNYVVINLDEPYIKEIIEIMKRHGHWG